ncbi:ATP-binding cassette domain-containing protein [uncultured Bacteroides sp.]|uniref:ABC transporter ATP-binding protein n=1 Tax=uncultured Bacteroides sp. TaxID=162156 RepID=UPI002AA7BECD|nr:ATP-binding cassette domain-containing protein [uncultured Bacteroides sp.]
MKTEQTEVLLQDSPGVKTKDIVIEITHLTKSFGTKEVLKDFSLKLYKGENLVVLGKSGSGKSVLIKCIVGLLRADAGIIKVFDRDVTTLTGREMDEMRRDIGFLFQSGALYDSMTVKQNLEFPLRRIGGHLTQKEIDTKIEEALENVGLLDALDKMPSQLSGGMRKRISLARTIVVDPKIILYDEPTTGLDPVTSDEISLLINDVQKKYKASSIIITHDIECARMTANRLIMLQDGEAYKEGNLSQFEKSTDSVIKFFFK